MMDREKDLLELCKPLFIKLTRVSNSEISKWKQNTKNIEHSHIRRRALKTGQLNDYKYSKLHKVRSIRNLGRKCIISDSDDESSEFQTFADSDINMTSDKYEPVNEMDTAADKIQSEIMDSALILPKKNMPSNDKPEWKYKQKRRKTSQSCNRTARKSENIEALIELQSNLNITIDHETPQVNLTKEIKIVSSRLEDSDDPQVERWRSKKKTFSSPKSKTRLPPKLYSLDCTVCSMVFENKEQLSNHIFKHTQRELQAAYKAAKIKLRESDSNVNVGSDSDAMDDGDVAPRKQDQFTITESPARKEVSQTTSTVSILMNTPESVSQTVPMIICSCHTNHPHNDESVQIEMVLLCETCHVLFRRSECFETHYRLSSKCNTDRTKGRTPKLFCSTCRVILNTLSNMRRHLEEHASINFHGTVTFVCNICRVVFFGVGTVFCTHWFNHEKDPTFVASRYSFPKLCVSTHGTKPSGSAPDEQYVFVAEYVCRSCKFQFSSESELNNHVEKDCKGVPSHIHPENKSEEVISYTSNSKSTKLKSDRNRPKIDSSPLKSLDIVSKWICEFCNECFPSRNAFEEHSSTHLQDDGYPGYSCVFQLSASTAFICNVCRGVHDSLRDLMKHWVTHEVIKFICTVCGEKCSSYNSFQSHISLACWKFKPDCRVWFNRQQHACKICTATYKTADELTQHYTLNHVTETETNITKIPSSQSLPIVETPPTSETSTSLRSMKNKSPKIVTNNSSEHIVNQTDFANLTVNNPTDTVINTPSAHLDIENSTSEKSPLQDLSTIKITIPNLLEQQSPSSCKDPSINDLVNFDNDTQNEISTEIRESPSASTPVNLSNGINKNTHDSSMIRKTVIIESLNVDKAPIKIPITDTCLHVSNFITTNTADLHNNNNSNSNNDNADNGILRQMNIGDLQLHGSMSTTAVNSDSSNTLNSLKNISMVNNISELNNGGDAGEAISERKIIEKRKNIADEVVKMGKNDEPDIIEIPNNSTVSSDTHRPQLMKLLNCESENHRSTCDAPNIRLLHQHTTCNIKNDCIRLLESTEKKDEYSNSDATKGRGFLRVKKFTELQAVRNYICNQCGAAFDNNKSLDEHTVAHSRRSSGNEKHPTMMAALILPQVTPNNTKQDVVSTSSLSSIPRMAGARVISFIPQQNVNAGKGVTSPLACGQVSNKSHNLPIIQSVPNIQNVQDSGQRYFSCPFCMIFHCKNVDEFTNHLSINHSNVNPSIFRSLLNETSQNRQKIYSCKVCNCSTMNRDAIVEHVRRYHLNAIPQIANIVPRISSESIPQVDLTDSATEGINTNTALPYNCSLCPNYTCNTFEELAQHFQRTHQSIIRKDVYNPYICDICFHQFQTYSELIAHLNHHRTTAWI